MAIGIWVGYAQPFAGLASALNHHTGFKFAIRRQRPAAGYFCSAQRLQSESGRNWKPAAAGQHEGAD